MEILGILSISKAFRYSGIPPDHRAKFTKYKAKKINMKEGMGKSITEGHALETWNVKKKCPHNSSNILKEGIWKHCAYSVILRWHGD